MTVAWNKRHKGECDEFLEKGRYPDAVYFAIVPGGL